MTKSYKKGIIFFYIFAAISLVTATFLDLNIDKFLYNPDSLIANWFWKTGELPNPLIIPFAGMMIMKCSEKLIGKIAGYILEFGGSIYFGCYFADNLFYDSDYKMPFGIIFGIGFAVCLTIIAKLIVIPEKAKKALVIVSIAGIAVMALQLGVIESVKIFWGRIRMREMIAQGNRFDLFVPWYKPSGIAESNEFKSFPSGHTTAAFAAMTAVYLTGNRKYSWTAFIFAFLMGISRIYLAVHFPSDVLGGVIVGLFAGIVGTLIASKLPSKIYGRKFYELTFRTPDKKTVKGDSYEDDFNASDKIGRVTFGNLGLYWKDLGKYYFCEYPYIDNAFNRISECSEDEFSQNYSYWRLILEHAGKEFANLIIDKEEDAKAALEKLKEKTGLS